MTHRQEAREPGHKRRLDRCTTCRRTESRIFFYEMELVAVSMTGEKWLGYGGRTKSGGKLNLAKRGREFIAVPASPLSL